MKKITPPLAIACVFTLFGSLGNTYARDIVSKKLPHISPTSKAPSEVQSTDGGFFDNDDLYIIQQINKERTSRGLNALRLFYYSGTNHTAAWVKNIGDREVLEHANDIVVGLPRGFKSAGENAGRGGTAKGIMRGYMGSSGHRANILKPSYNAVVSASYRARNRQGRLIFYNVVRFMALPNLTGYELPPAPFTVAGTPCTVLGTHRNDTIITDKPEHVVLAFGGNDTITGASVVGGGRGHDTITGTSGNDRLYGHGGWDKIYGLEGDDRLYGSSGNDNIRGHAGNDTIYGGYGDDIIYAHSGNDTVYGQKGSDRIYGGPGVDTIYPGPAGDNNTVVD